MKKKLLEITLQASQVIMKLYNSGEYSVSSKVDKSPVTEADKSANEIISQGLIQHFSYPIQSEEHLITYRHRKSWDKFWLVDPLDGTRDFINKTGDFTINIALIEGSQPILGLIHHPCTGITVFSDKNKGVFICDKFGKDKMLSPPLSGPFLKKMLQSNYHPNQKDFLFLKNNPKVKDIINMGSSLKFYALATGKAGIYVRFTPSKEWDIASGHIIIKELGLEIRDLMTKKEPVYNKKTVENNPFVVYNPNVFKFEELIFED